MAFRTPRARTGLRRRPRWLIPAAAGVIVLLVALGVFTTVWTDVLWYQAIGYLPAYATRLRARLVLFFVAAIIMAASVAVNIWLAYRLRPPYRSLTPEQQGLERYRTILEPRQGLVLAAIAVIVGLITGLSMEGRWQTWLTYLNRQSFGTTDPLFHRDVSYFVFTYPFLRMVVGYAFAVVVVSVIAAAVTHYLYGGIRLQSQDDKVSGASRAHLSVLVGVFVLLKAWAYWLDRYGLVYQQRGRSDSNGAWYTDVNAVLPAKTILAVIAVLCAVLFFAAVVRRGVLLPAAGFGLLVLSAILIGGVYPAIVQRFQVEPTELAKETPYIKRNIQATRDAFSVDDVKATGYNATTDPSNVPASAQQGDIAGVRLLDPGVVPPTFQQLQQIRGFYQFPKTLDVGRYDIDGEKKAAVVAVRGLPSSPQGRGNWVNAHLTFTHGFGFVAADASTVRSGGSPDFVASDIPPRGKLGDFQPRIYFGQQVPDYSIVGGGGPGSKEFDFPDESVGGQQNNVYRGSGGVAIGSSLRQLVYALQFQDTNILISGEVKDGSRLMYIRQPRERIKRVAPFLDLDGNPYPAVVNGRIKWIVDAYTTTDMYPYSTRTGLEQATTDTRTVTSQNVVAQPQKQVNYIRNSVKAVVDAYSGKVTLYNWDKQDPVLQTWKQAFPNLIQPKSAVPDGLMQHLRYPTDLFKVQREILRRYHVTQPSVFYNGSDFWQVPNDPTAPGGSEPSQPPYYLMLQMPGADEPNFSLSTTYVPKNRPNLAAFMAVNSTPGPNYGQLRILRLPRSTSIAGPGQMQNDFRSYPPAQTNLSLLGRGGAEVVYGNLLTLPVGGGLLYVEPVYVKAAGGQAYPLMQRVLVSFGNRIGYGASLEKALAQVFPDAGQPSAEEPSAEQPSGGATANPQVQAALEDAQQAYQDAQDALRQGDFQAYGEAQQRLEDALDQAMQAEDSAAAGAGGGSSGSSSSGSPGG